MNRRIRATPLLRALCFLLCAQFATAVAAAPTDAEIEPLLDQLGVRALIEQSPAILAVAIEAQAQAAPPLQSAPWRRELETQLRPQVLLPALKRYLGERYDADAFRRAQQRLQHPLAKRARYFDLAMTQPGVDKNLRDFLQHHRLIAGDVAAQPVGSESVAADAPVAEARRVLLREIDAASAGSLLTATLQSAIAARVRLASADAAFDPNLLADEIAERQRYLAPLAEGYLLYDYRYLRDDELGDYRDLLRDDAVQWLLDLCRQALLAAILGEFTPPPAPLRSS